MRRAYAILLSFMLISIVVVPLTDSAQPPVVTDTLEVGTIGWGPVRADPVRAYDTASGGLLFNVYDTLIAMGTQVINTMGTWLENDLYWEFSPSLSTNVPQRQDLSKIVSSSDVDVSDPTGSNWSDGSTCIGWVDNNPLGSFSAEDTLYMTESSGAYRTWRVSTFDSGPPVTVTLERSKYVFHMRTSPIVSFVNSTGDLVDIFDVYDAEYSFERGLVHDQAASPMWMYYKPLFDQMNSNWWDTGSSTRACELARLIDDAFEVEGDDLVINLGFSFPDAAFKQVLCQSWGSIMSKEWCIAKGCWGGELLTLNATTGYPLWWAQWRRKNSPIYTVNVANYAGTGAYRVTVADSGSGLVSLQRNPLYWKGWPAPQRKAYLEYVNINYVADWQIRRDGFIDGTYDICSVPGTSMNELLDAFGEPLYPDIKTVKNAVSLTNENLFFNFRISSDSPFLGSGQFPNGIPTDFFNNTHVRKAFAYAFNYSKYLQMVYSGEALRLSTTLISGLYPDYEVDADEYDMNLDLAEAELKNATFGAQSVWEAGFKLSCITHVSSTPSWFDLMKEAFDALSTYNGRPLEWPDFVLELYHWDPFWPTDFFDYPMYRIGWLADFADADNFIRPFMYSLGDFSYVQSYTEENGWGNHKDELIDLAAKIPDGPQRAAYYAELQQIFIQDCPCIPLAQATGRKWMKYWVKGVYSNPIEPSPRYYYLFKEDTCWADVSSASLGMPDVKVDMRDISYIAGHFGAKAPDPSLTPPYDPKWAPDGYGCGCCDVYGDRKIDMRDVSFACTHFMHAAQP